MGEQLGQAEPEELEERVVGAERVGRRGRVRTRAGRGGVWREGEGRRRGRDVRDRAMAARSRGIAARGHHCTLATSTGVDARTWGMHA